MEKLDGRPIKERKEENHKMEENGVKDRKKGIKEILLRRDNLILVILAGILLMVIALPSGKKETSVYGLSDSMTQSLKDQTGGGEGITDESCLQSGIEKRLENALLEMEGCREVSVLITFRETQEGYHADYDYCFIYPEIEGIAVLINDGDKPQNVEKVTAVIQALFPVDAHRITVANKKTSGYGGQCEERIKKESYYDWSISTNDCSSRLSEF